MVVSIGYVCAMTGKGLPTAPARTLISNRMRIALLLCVARRGQADIFFFGRLDPESEDALAESSAGL
jgi:hypothetical protein